MLGPPCPASGYVTTRHTWPRCQTSGVNRINAGIAAVEAKNWSVKVANRTASKPSTSRGAGPPRPPSVGAPDQGLRPIIPIECIEAPGRGPSGRIPAGYPRFHSSIEIESMDRAAAYTLMTTHVADQGLRRHMLAVEAAMRSYADAPGRRPRDLGPGRAAPRLRLGDPPHARAAPGRGCTRSCAQRGCDETVVRAILSHNTAGTGVERESPIEFALLACDEITGLLSASALVRPDKDIRAGADPLGPEEVEGQGVRARRRSRARAGLDRGLQPRLLRRQPRAVGPRRQRAAGDAGRRRRPRSRRAAGGSPARAPAGAGPAAST